MMMRGPEPRSPNPEPFHRGQAMIEMAIAFTGLVMFIYVFLKVWTWSNGTIVQRQEAFKASRLAAGKVASPGKPVNYHRPMLQLVGDPDALESLPPILLPPPPPPPPPPAPCTAGQPFYEEADRLDREAADLLAQAVAILTPLAEEGDRNRARLDEIKAAISADQQRIKDLKQAMKDADCSNADPTPACADMQAERDRLNGEIKALKKERSALRKRQRQLRKEITKANKKAKPLIKEAMKKQAEARELRKKGDEACKKK